MRQGTLFTGRSSSGKGGLNCFVFLTIFSLALNSSFPPLAFILVTFLESHGSALSLCLAPSSRRLLLEACRAPLQLPSLLAFLA